MSLVAKMMAGKNRAMEALSLRLAGATFREVGEKMGGVSAARARSLCLKGETLKNSVIVNFREGNRVVKRWMDT